MARGSELTAATTTTAATVVTPADAAVSGVHGASCAIAAVCQLCEVAFHQFRPRFSCTRCAAQVCQFCSWRSATAVSCRLCHPERKSEQPAFSLRQFLWSVKLLPFGCRAEKWFYYARRRRSPTCYSSISKEQYVELMQQLYATNTSRSSDQQRMIDQDVERTFHQLQTTATARAHRTAHHHQYLQPSLRSARKRFAPLSDADMLVWRAATRELLSAFLLLKPQIGYCQGMTHVAAVIVHEAKLNCETAFRLFLCMTETYRMDLLYGPEMRDVNLRFFQLDETLRRHLRSLHAHMSDLGVHPTTYASSWILTLFTDGRVLPHACVLLFLDEFFKSGWKAFFRVALMLFVDAKSEVMKQHSAEDVVAVLTDVPRILTAQYGRDTSRFIAAASALKLSNAFLHDLEVEYWTQGSLCE